MSTTTAPQTAAIPGVDKIIAVASGKGGVGKSTTAVQLALALNLMGKKVGLLDADIYGPSVPAMLGISEDARPDIMDGNRFVPMQAHGIHTLSMGNLSNESTPMVWRGPMASGALMQMLNQTQWGELDVLIVDMPPGTGDIQLTLAQKASVDGAVIVTTPQDIALKDAIKGVEMFRKVSIPVLGIVENMAIHRCSNCGHEEHIFGAGGAQRMAATYGVGVLASMPLDIRIREDLDDGLPTLVKAPEGDLSQLYIEMAAAVLRALDGGSQAPAFPEILID